jgi:hypothetical protein
VTTLAGRLALLAVLAASVAAGEPLEPPSEAPLEADYVAEPADSIDTGTIVARYSFSGRNGGSVGRRRSLEYRGDSLDVAVRDGDDEPFAGGDLDARDSERDVRIGRISPRWGLGLALGTPAEPWSAAGVRGATPLAPRGRSGEGAWVTWRSLGVEAGVGQFRKVPIGGLALRRGGAGFGIATDRTGSLRGSVGWEGDDAALEWALDRSGRWRGEAVVARATGASRWTLRARGGHAAFHGLAEPVAAAPSRAVSAAIACRSRAVLAQAAAAAWSFGRETCGARAMLGATFRPAAGRSLDVGWEEQHGLRRAPATPPRVPRGMRQGTWVEWRGGGPALTLAVRHEVWGRQAFARSGVRRSLGAGVETRLPFGVELRVSHTVYRARSGETIYLPEHEADRWVLRALSGSGARTRLTVRVPCAGGSAQGELGLRPVRGETRATWNLGWTRRVRVRRGT